MLLWRVHLLALNNKSLRVEKHCTLSNKGKHNFATHGRSLIVSD
jgi:hypothetical protein